MTRAQGLATTTVGAAVVLYKFISKQSHSEYYRAAIRAIRSYSMFSKTRENSKKRMPSAPSALRTETWSLGGRSSRNILGERATITELSA